MGERTPHLDPEARGMLAGITASHTRGHVTRAILEGVAFSLKDTFSIFQEMSVPVKSIRLGGGGAHSALWRQIQADVYGHEVEVVEAEEGAAYGGGASRGRRGRDMAHCRRGVPDGCARCSTRAAGRGECLCYAIAVFRIPPNVSRDEIDLSVLAVRRSRRLR